MKIAVVHDWLTGWRGGEVVLGEILDLYPSADLFALISIPGALPPSIESRLRETSFLSSIPGVARIYRHLMPFYAAAAEGLDLRGYDLVLSSSHSAAKGVRKDQGAVHLCYCHTPARWAWDLFDEYFPSRKFSPLWWFIRWQVARFRRWDLAVSGPDRIDEFAANSFHVAARIERIYGRSARVIPPPVDVDFFTPVSVPPGDYHLMVSALVPYKRVDLAVRAFAGRRDRLVVVGSGPENERLRAMAPRNVEFTGNVSRDRLRELYRGCRGYLQVADEDFGIATGEALACGRPVVAWNAGGTREIVTSGRSGLLFDDRTPSGISQAIDQMRAMAFNNEDLRAAADLFRAQTFRTSFRKWVEEQAPPPGLPVPTE